MKTLLILLSILFTSTLYAGDKLSTLDATSLFGESTVETVILDKKAMMDISGKGFSRATWARIQAAIIRAARVSAAEHERRHVTCINREVMMRSSGFTVPSSFYSDCMRGF